MPTSKRWAWHKFRETMIYLYFFTSMTNSKVDSIIYSRTWSRTNKHRQVVLSNWSSLRHTIVNQTLPFFLPTKYAMVPQHGPFSLHTMLDGPWLHKTAFPTPMVQPLDESQGASPLHGHGSWLVCDRGEAAVSYKWTGWVWEIAGWSWRLDENYRSF